MRYAVGIIHHPVTGRWQPWVFSEGADGVAFACVSSHANKAQAHLVARIILHTYHTHGMADPAALVRHSQESDGPDPLPHEVLDTLLATNRHQAEGATADTILEY